MTESLDDLYRRKEKELGDQYRDWYFREVALDRSQFSGPHAVPTYPASVSESLASARAFDEYIRRLEAVQGTRAAMTAGPALGHMLVANMQSLERIRRECPVEWPGDRLLGLEVQTSNHVPKDTAYVVRKPDLFPIQYEPIEFIPDNQHEPRMFRVWQDLTVKLGVPRSILYTACDIADEAPRVKWPEPVVPAQPLSWWQWLMIVGFLSWVLCALSRAV